MRNITVKIEKKVEKQLVKLPKNIVRKLHKQIYFLLDDIQHPSLHSKKLQGTEIWEARVDYHYRFTFIVKANSIVILTVGMHDEGLGRI
ncbi:MAG TPA: type II toxin-antitoxin system RelE/ParE family toxin [Candidatus Woesebacteria bacterium]|nr:type II toxin-antitoxin system RelE/ParE family toxin [Candidatus Woesebacteria bacterium]